MFRQLKSSRSDNNTLIKSFYENKPQHWKLDYIEDCKKCEETEDDTTGNTQDEPIYEPSGEGTQYYPQYSSRPMYHQYEHFERIPRVNGGCNCKSNKLTLFIVVYIVVSTLIFTVLLGGSLWLSRKFTPKNKQIDITSKY